METTVKEFEDNVSLTPQNAFSNAQSFELLQRIAKTFASSAIVPPMYKMKNPNDVEARANCIIAVDMAMRMHANPMMVMQNLYIVHGNPGWSSKFLIAALNQCGKFSPLRYEFSGEEGTDAWKCRAYAIDKATGDELKGAWVSIDMAKKEGWYNKQGSKWQTMPELMLQYRAAAFFQRTYAPEISMGMPTVEENEDIYISSTSPVVQPINTAENGHTIEISETESQATSDLFDI